MTSAPRNALKTLSQLLGIIALAFLLGMVLHKGHADISVLAAKYSGEQFWLELAKHLVANLAGGGNAASK